MEFEYGNEILRTIILLAFFVVINLIIKNITRRFAKVSHLSEARTNLISKYIDIIIFILVSVGAIAIWSVKSEDIFNFVGATLTVIGVAFFAQWSILSNITSGIIMFFTFPFRIGHMIRIHDKDFPVEGQIEDIKTFHTILRTRDGEIVTYPNSLLLQKGVSIVPQKDEDSGV
ncbi:mechanosensitive ion channel domain-containing protein [Flavobacterium sp. RHBU_3]|uniref:mechanosensitive ion channel domain-containing protein n=1 Tax=Flavobacterium sp. RHBU_3 TaxID=3391184 RepID=UPI0039852C0E